MSVEISTLKEILKEQSKEYNEFLKEIKRLNEKNEKTLELFYELYIQISLRKNEYIQQLENELIKSEKVPFIEFVIKELNDCENHIRDIIRKQGRSIVDQAREL